jgi:hypothetical protein
LSREVCHHCWCWGSWKRLSVSGPTVFCELVEIVLIIFETKGAASVVDVATLHPAVSSLPSKPKHKVLAPLLIATSCSTIVSRALFAEINLTRCGNTLDANLNKLVRLVSAAFVVKKAVQVVPLTPFSLGDAPTAKAVDTSVSSSAVKVAPVFGRTADLPPRANAVSQLFRMSCFLVTTVPSTKCGKLTEVWVPLASISVDSINLRTPNVEEPLATHTLFLGNSFSGDCRTGCGVRSGSRNLTYLTLSVAVLKNTTKFGFPENTQVNVWLTK